jgi:hypothetical protein
MSGQDVYSFYEDDENVAIEGEPVAPKRRAKLSSHLPIRFSPAVLAAARRLASADGMSVSSWVRWLVEREVVRRTPAETALSTQGNQFVPSTEPETRTAKAVLVSGL